MARVVQRRTPPYLLIVFVILFIFATVMAVLFFNRLNTAEEQMVRLRQTEAQLISIDQSNLPEIKYMIEQYKSRQGGVAQTVVGQLRSEISQLAGDITGSPNSTFAEAKERIEATFRTINPPTRRGLLSHMTDFSSQLGVKETETAKLKTDAEQLRAEVAKIQAQKEAAETAHQQALAEKDSQFAASEAKYTALARDMNAKREEDKKQFDDSVAELRKQMEALGKLLEARTRERDLLGVQYAELLKKLTPRAIDTEQVVTRPDGKVVSVVPAAGMAYLNIGAKDNVTEGLQFSVYPYTGVPKDGKGKGVLEVVNIFPEICEARIIQQDKENPIIAGDVVANVVFDSLKSYNLLVEGNFDINGTGAATPVGNKAIKELIRRYGGTVVNALGVETNFVILGEAPEKLKKPEDTDPQESWELYQDRLKDYNRYQQIKDDAASMKIPVIGSRRFLDLIGYVPTKAKAD